jgi:asparagine synthase (glutamine-hydrolysing)
MCGIAGILAFNGRPVPGERIANLTDALAHRGRDSAAYLHGGSSQPLSSYGGIALGHRRLSIIDLSDGAAQPMRSASTGNVLVYNGELYNYVELRKGLLASGYRFRTDSDSEVVLAAYDVWGESCLARFNGMYAFAVWDEARQWLFCARDPVGIKPFYYVFDDEEIAFASESQALVRGSNHGLDRDAAACYLLSMYVPRTLSIYSGVKKLLPGHSMRVHRGGACEIVCFWHLSAATREGISVEQAAEELLDALDAAVKHQLRSDVPVGVLLSGGFDSGMILASASRAQVPLHSYSVGYADGQQESELSIAEEMAGRYKTIHHQRVIADNEVLALLEKSIASLSEPVADTAIVSTYCLSGMAADDGVKVLLSGTGGDEVFAGYSRYVGSSFPRQVLYCLPDSIRQALGATVFSNSIAGARLQHRSLDMMIYAGGSPPLARSLFESDKAFLLFLEKLACSVFPVPDKDLDPLYAHMSFDMQAYLPDLLLMLFDQLTMVHTIEGRVPLLDLDLLAASYSLPSALHANPQRKATRLLMRRMAEGRVSPRTFKAKKLGFSGPVVSWVKSNESEFCEGVMALRDHPLAGSIPIEKLWNEGRINPTRAWAMQVFSLYCFSIWSRNHACI